MSSQAADKNQICEEEGGKQLKKRRRRNDLFLLALLALAAALLLVWQAVQRHGAQTAALSLLVTVGNEEVLRAPLAADAKSLQAGAEISADVEKQAVRIQFDETGFTVSTEAGYNHFSVETDETGKAGIRCDAADCPDLVCVDTGLIRMENELIVCLPHRLSLRLIKTGSNS